MPRRPCTDCGEPHEGAGRCPDCARAADVRRPRASREARGYGWRWRQLSIRARKRQPFCDVCGATKDLTTDHSEEAWRRHAQGLPVRLEDVRVMCRPCNARKGRARPPGHQGRDPEPGPSASPPVNRRLRYTPRTSDNAEPSHYVGDSDQEVGA